MKGAIYINKKNSKPLINKVKGSQRDGPQKNKYSL